MPLSEDAKKELHNAIAMVREDRLEKHIRSRFAGPAKDPLLDDDPPTPPTPPVDPPKPPKGTPAPPPPKPADPPVVDPPVDPKRKSSYWGELTD